jgi:hypothetical protein
MDLAATVDRTALAQVSSLARGLAQVPPSLDLRVEWMLKDANTLCCRVMKPTLDRVRLSSMVLVME